MLGTLTDKISHVLSKLGAKKRLTESQLDDGIREIRLALIDADVNLLVIKTFIAKVKAAALGQEVLKAVSPFDMFVKIVRDELVAILGGHVDTDTDTDTDKDQDQDLMLLEPTRITNLLVCGLQGSGKTTTCGKLALKLKEKRDVMTVSLDIARPAANEQLKILTEQAGVTFYDRGTETNLKQIIKDATRFAKKNVHNLILWDTAGRIQVDKDLMKELSMVVDRINPSETILVCDSMTGQQALSVAEEFKSAVKISSLIFTKFDSDTRGGAVLSVREIVKAPVKYIGVGEKLSDLDNFVPQRIAERILGMGDIVALVDKAQGIVDEDQANKLAEKIKKNEFDLQDFLEQIGQLKKMGSMQSMLEMIPGMSQKLKGVDVDEGAFDKMQYIIQSMTKVERTKPFIISNSRKQRISKGSGTNVMDVNQLLKKFQEMKAMMKKMSNPKKMKQMLGNLMGSDSAAGMPGDMSLMNSMKGFPGLNN